MIDGIWDRREAIEKVAACQPSHGKSCPDKDDIQNARSANADEDAVDIGVIQAVLGIVGFVGLIYTVIYARGAWLAALDTLKETERANMLQLRPYVFAELNNEKSRKPIRRTDEIGFRIKNYGQTPARNVVLRRGDMSTPLPIGTQEVGLEHPEETLGSIPPGGHADIQLPLDAIDPQIIDLIEEGVWVLMIRVRVDYEYAPGKTDADDLTVLLTRDSMVSGGVFVMSGYHRGALPSRNPDAAPRNRDIFTM